MMPISAIARCNLQQGLFGFDHRVGHFRPPGMVDEIPKPPVLQRLRCFSVGRRLLGWPTP